MIKEIRSNNRQSEAFEALRDHVIEAIEKHRLTEMEALALASQLVGMMLASQDPTSISKEEAILMVQRNIEYGNHSTINAGRPNEDRLN